MALGSDHAHLAVSARDAGKIGVEASRSRIEGTDAEAGGHALFPIWRAGQAFHGALSPSLGRSLLRGPSFFSGAFVR